jgi:hypothetical protein
MAEKGTNAVYEYQGAGEGTCNNSARFCKKQPGGGKDALWQILKSPLWWADKRGHLDARVQGDCAASIVVVCDFAEQSGWEGRHGLSVAAQHNVQPAHQGPLQDKWTALPILNTEELGRVVYVTSLWVC